MVIACPVQVEGVAYAVAVAGPTGRVAARAVDYAAAIRSLIGALE